MKQHIALTLSIFGTSLLPAAAFAQEFEGCFLLDEKNRVIELDSLCPGQNFSLPGLEGEGVLPPPPGTPSVGLNSGGLLVPIKYRLGGIPVVDVTFNNSQTFEMLVDTGASGTVITDAVAKALGIETVGTAQIDTASGKDVEFPLGIVDSIDVGGASIQNVTVGIASALDLGLLGQDLLGQYDVTIRDGLLEFQTR
ncbi:retroviral-like aspartic protease family protein [Oscillatoriales cyanobacterium LEGE 11467]|uniref:Retroviral-like aspartic protease family protein n=2 Tax=Zarconia TaxID=2992130 RepID=A0A928W0P9_9CYAN|nr:retroviral-like aspartic protease family protein [Zarconia navalis LEGE 11467]